MRFVYAYFSKDKECKYVGQSVDWKRRYYQHCRTDMKDKIEEIEYILVYRCANNKMISLESYLINMYLPEWNTVIPSINNKPNMNYYKPFLAPTKMLKRFNL